MKKQHLANEQPSECREQKKDGGGLHTLTLKRGTGADENRARCPPDEATPDENWHSCTSKTTPRTAPPIPEVFVSTNGAPACTGVQVSLSKDCT